MNDKERIDIHLVAQGYFDSREKARRAIMAGVVNVNGLRIDKPGTTISVGSQIHIASNPNPYVSRGGLKLHKALTVFELNVAGMTAIDIGASTGGFTDCLLKHGASKVYAVDVGYGQLDWNLRNDPRVVNLERTNIRYLDPSLLSDKVDIATIDTSFISVTKFISKLHEIAKDDALVVTLIKPQFEAGREHVGKKGVVRDPKIHRDVIRHVLTTFTSSDFLLTGLTYSPITGPEGNIEFLAVLKLGGSDSAASEASDIFTGSGMMVAKHGLRTVPDDSIYHVVESAHSAVELK
jgi:23S rRNA (cytidine1920-2'-O)/16S rRNA (cytidine1409-2'-O)-methyltransferase